MGDSNNLPTQKINYFKVGEYLEAIRYSLLVYICNCRNIVNQPTKYCTYVLDQ